MFPATSPLEALRFVLSREITAVNDGGGREVVIKFLDISRAHLHAPVRWGVSVRACGEDTERSLGRCWNLLQAMYGLRDASTAFDGNVESVVENFGVQSLVVQSMRV